MPGEKPQSDWCLRCNGTKRLVKRKQGEFKVEFVPCTECCAAADDLYFTVTTEGQGNDRVGLVTLRGQQ